jgi:hypothetical protein
MSSRREPVCEYLRLHCLILNLISLNIGVDILNEQIVHQNGPYKRVKRWIRGIYPKLGIIHKGLTGWETVVEKDVIVPNYTFIVVECMNNSSAVVPNHEDTTQ